MHSDAVGGAPMTGRPEVCLLDVNETLSDLSTLGDRFASIGLDGQQEAWFASVLRDGLALTMTGRAPLFREVAVAQLRHRLTAAGRSGVAVEEGVELVLDGMTALSLHPDVAPGLRRLHAAGIRLVPLTNGATAMSDTLFERAGVLDLFERRLSVESVGAWKPHSAPYAYALEQVGVPAENALLVAVHPWDLQGGRTAAVGTAWIRRDAGEWPACFDAPDLVASGFEDLAEQLLGG
jgi:2-haloacid dehalogenase